MTKFRTAAAAILAAVATAASAQPASPPAGMEDCEACHGLTKDAPPSIGPSLWGVGGRKAGSVADYAYSPAMKAYGVTWTSETLTPFLQHPTTTVAGTTMAYPGVPDPAAAKAIADYLLTLHD